MISHPKVVIAIWQELIEFRAALTAPAEYIYAPSSDEADIVRLLPDADALISPRFTRKMANFSNTLRLIQTPGAGTNSIDFSAVPPATAVCNVYGHERGIAEHVFTVMSMINRDYPGMDARLRNGDWSDHSAVPRPELQGKTLTIIGLGRIGSEVARWGTFLGMRVVAATRTPDADMATALGVDLLTGMDCLHDVLVDTDFAVLAVPLDSSTRGLIGETELTWMGPNACLINVARGEVVEEEALYNALDHHTIATAAIDVWYQYPANQERTLPSSFPFHTLPNVIMTPHIAGATSQTFAYRWRAINENILRLGRGDELINIVRL